MGAKIYQSLDALKPVKKVLAEAGTAVNKNRRNLFSSGVSEALGAIGGIGLGAASGAGLVGAGAASGTAGAAALTSGLATAGGFLGGGMMMGIAVAAAPAVLLGVGGLAAVSYWNKCSLKQEGQALLQEALRKHQAIQNELRSQGASNKANADYLQALVVKLEDIIQNLRGDLGPEPV